MHFSIIIPVYNRPEEIQELLESLSGQDYSDFEVWIIEDGSELDCKEIVRSFKNRLNIHYEFIQNIGQGFARNHGMKLAKGEYFVLFDSDCIIPPAYLSNLNRAIIERKLDAHGGPDAAADDFSPLQKAMNYSMTAFLTTGGIRGAVKDPKKYQARGFNMGLSRKAFQESGGFRDANMAEDIELSIRLRKMGFNLQLVEEAYVFHKRKNTWFSFFRQSYSFGRNRVNVSRYHQDSIKLVHLMPVAFLLGWVLLLVLSLMSGIGMQITSSLISLLTLAYLIWGFLLLLDAWRKNRSLKIALMALGTSFGQLSAYGLGIISESLKKWGKG